MYPLLCLFDLFYSNRHLVPQLILNIFVYGAVGYKCDLEHILEAINGELVVRWLGLQGVYRLVTGGYMHEELEGMLMICSTFGIFLLRRCAALEKERVMSELTEEEREEEEKKEKECDNYVRTTNMMLVAYVLFCTFVYYRVQTIFGYSWAKGPVVQEY